MAHQDIAKVLGSRIEGAISITEKWFYHNPKELYGLWIYLRRGVDVRLAADKAIISEGFVFERAPFGQCHASTIVQTREGDLLTAFFAGTEEGHGDVAIWLSRGDGSGWSPPSKVAWDEGAPCWNPVLFRDAGEKIYLFYKAGPSPETWSGVYLTSDDDGVNWSQPHHLPAGLLGPIKNKPITMSNGDVICGTSTESYRAWACWVEIMGEGGWGKFGPIYYEGVNEGIIQPSIVEFSGGVLRMFVRSTQRIGRICSADSSDYGRTWSRATATALPNPDSGIDCVKMRSGAIAMIYNDSTTSRTPLSAAVSADGGRTWTKALDLETGDGEFSYPSVIQATDGRLHAVYTWKRKRIKHIALDNVQLERALDST
jgi:predicted neuraminidase